MIDHDSFSAPATNAFEFTVSELSTAIKSTVEESFGHVRLRGEVSGYRGPHSSGHVYFSLKDQNARIDAIIWKGVFGRLSHKPQEGLEIVATGRITTFPGKSSYQIVIDTLEPAGIGALMALLEERKKKLTAEGLFDPAHKQKIPFLPSVIGVVTSPTGAVIRDILHRLEDRFPRSVLVWPVRVQGETAAQEIAAAIRGFNALPAGGTIPRPDVLIVARGGGSIEDLWCFNEEEVVRAAFESSIPLISAVGHETDWTLIDYAADLRAPTPTGAAEMVVPVRSELLMTVHGLVQRLDDGMFRQIDRRRQDLRSLTRVFPKPDDLFAVQRQRLDLSSARLLPSLQQILQKSEKMFHAVSHSLGHLTPKARLARMQGRFSSIANRPQEALTRRLSLLSRDVQNLGERLKAAQNTCLRFEKEKLARHHERIQELSQRMQSTILDTVKRRTHQLSASVQLFESLNYKTVLKRGYALVREAVTQKPIRSAASVSSNIKLTIELSDGTFSAVSGELLSGATPKSLRASKKTLPSQGNLFEED